MAEAHADDEDRADDESEANGSPENPNAISVGRPNATRYCVRGVSGVASIRVTKATVRTPTAMGSATSRARAMLECRADIVSPMRPRGATSNATAIISGYSTTE